MVDIFRGISIYICRWSIYIYNTLPRPTFTLLLYNSVVPGSLPTFFCTWHSRSDTSHRCAKYTPRPASMISWVLSYHLLSGIENGQRIFGLPRGAISTATMSLALYCLLLSFVKCLLTSYSYHPGFLTRCSFFLVRVRKRPRNVDSASANRPFSLISL